MRSIVHSENGQVVYDAVSEEYNANIEAPIINIILVAIGGEITITDFTNNKAYKGTYALSAKTPKGTDYHITLEGKSGYATVAMTKYADGKEEPTLPIAIDGYSIYFYAE